MSVHLRTSICASINVHRGLWQSDCELGWGGVMLWNGRQKKKESVKKNKREDEDVRPAGGGRT